MRASTLLSAVIAVWMTASLAACGGRSGLELPDVVNADADADVDTGLPADSAPPPEDAGMCVPACETDLECQLSCAALPEGELNCCDRRVGTCYQYEGSACPRGPRDGGVVPPY